MTERTTAQEKTMTEMSEPTVEKVAARQRHNADDPLLVTQRETQTFTLETPVGEVEVAYGRDLEITGYRGGSWRSNDWFQTRFRGETLSSTHLRAVSAHGAKSSRQSLVEMVVAAEAAHHSKATHEKARKEAAKTPLPALLTTVAGKPSPFTTAIASKVVNRVEAFDLEEVRVRGIDQRSGDALITRQSGAKESVRPSLLLNDLDQHDRHDVRTAVQQFRRARDEAEARATTSASNALKVAGICIDLRVRYSIENDRREAHLDLTGRDYFGATEKDIVEQIVRDLLLSHTEHRYVKTNEYGFDDKASDIWAPIEGGPWVPLLSKVARSAREYRIAIETRATAEQAAVALDSLVDQHQFDLSLFTGETKTPTVRIDPEAAGLRDAVAQATPPAEAPEWDD